MKTIEQRITEDIYDALEEMVALNGYEHDYTVARHRRIGDQVDTNTITLVDGGLAMHEMQSLGRDRWVKTYRVVVPLMHNDESSDAEGDIQSKFQADLIKALISTYSRGGIALDTRFMSSEPIEDPAMAGVVLTFEVHFWTLKDDPYRQSS